MTFAVMDGPLVEALIHIISNAEYYSDSIYHHALQLVTNFIYQVCNLSYIDIFPVV